MTIAIDDDYPSFVTPDWFPNCNMKTEVVTWKYVVEDVHNRKTESVKIKHVAASDWFCQFVTSSLKQSVLDLFHSFRNSCKTFILRVFLCVIIEFIFGRHLSTLQAFASELPIRCLRIIYLDYLVLQYRFSVSVVSELIVP